ncbi:DUF4142 domain-containing protein [Sphingomonas floccifaciens]|uniref:DUF4142 domain-containing protein n=1 Tax=Sphingomonas floccifaciens TaxID=1844115 RepID=A0ABW4NDK9_9SPHN
MTIRTTIITATAFLALSACGKGADTTATNTAVQTANTSEVALPPAAPAMTAAQSFANAAAASDAFEIATSQLALSKSASASIKSFAQKMIDGHTASTAKLKTAAAEASPAVTPDPTLTAEQQQTLNQMKALNGSAFDQGYIAAQASGHQRTLDVLRAYAASGDTPSLKAFAADLVPTVTAHLNTAKGLTA